MCHTSWPPVRRPRTGRSALALCRAAAARGRDRGPRMVPARLRPGGSRTPAPFDPPRQLVATGLYRWVRNPDVSQRSVAARGEAALLENARVLRYARDFFLVAHLFVGCTRAGAGGRRFTVLAPPATGTCRAERRTGRRPATSAGSSYKRHEQSAPPGKIPPRSAATRAFRAEPPRHEQRTER